MFWEGANMCVLRMMVGIIFMTAATVHRYNQSMQQKGESTTYESALKKSEIRAAGIGYLFWRRGPHSTCELSLRRCLVFGDDWGSGLCHLV